MNTLTIDHNNGHSTTYQLIEAYDQNMPIAYHVDTSKDVIAVLERVRKNRQRIRIYLGDTDTGKCWNEEHDIMGYIGLSTGHKAHWPLLVYNERSYGGGLLMDNRIIKIKEAKGSRVLYQAANFQQPNIEVKESTENGYTHSVYIDGELYSNHKTEKQAQILAKKLS